MKRQRLEKLLYRLKLSSIVCDSQVVVGNRVLVKGNLNDAVNVASQHLVSVNVFLKYNAVVVLVNHLLLGCAKRVSVAQHSIDTGHVVIAFVGWVLLHFECGV